MSSNLCWQPIKQNWRDLPDQLKYVLQKRNEGSLANFIMDRSDIPYLSGLKDAGIKGAETLIDAIEKHYEIEVKEIF